MLLQNASWPEVEAYLAGSKGIIIPIGSHEQHGPNGLVGTDAICPEVIAREAGAESGLMVGPTFSIGVAQHHLGFAGSMTLRPSTMIATILDWVESLARHGFTRIYFLNGHGGNIATIGAAFAEYYANYSLDGEPCPVVLKQRNWWELPGIYDLCARMFPVGHGSHATASEVAVTYYAYPDAVKDVEMSPKIAPDGDFTDAADYRATFPDGRIGSDPSQATVEKGETIVKASRAALIEEAGKFFATADAAQAAAE
jgi:creatinine amidohydrolase/Fe(II)-dependent formamide hydrolase-like protein